MRFLMFKACSLLLLLSGPVLAQPEMPPAPVQVGEASIEMLAPVSRVSGTVASRSDARLSAEVEGRLITVLDVGEQVRAGDPLAQIDDTRFRLMRDELEAEVDRAQARLKYLQAEEERFTKLAKSNLAAATQLDQTRADRDVAKGDLAVARSRLAQNQYSLDRTIIRAPFDGVVVERLKMAGERVSEGSDVIRLVDQSNLEIIARAPLDFYPHVSIGMDLAIEAGSLKRTAKIRAVVALGSEAVHQFEMRLDLADGTLPVGQTLRVLVPNTELKEVLSVPRDALVLRPNGATVFVVDEGNQARQVAVIPGIGAGDRIEVSGELNPGDRVVIRGNERLQPGQTVSVSGG